MRGTVDKNVETVRDHYNRLFDLLDRGTSYSDSGWNQRPPIVNLGYWSHGATEAREAQIAFVRELASRLPDLKGLRVLDVGCGLCGPAVILAADYGAKVECININEQQVKWARQFIAGNGLEDKVQVRVASAMDIPFRNQFDVVFCLESAHCYIDKPRFLSGALAALRTGGKLVLADITGTSHFALFVYQPALKLNLVTADDWRSMIEKTGFTLESLMSVGSSVYPGYRRWLNRTSGERRARIFNKICPNGATFPFRQMRQLQAWALEFALCRSVLPLLSWLKLRDYVVIVARKEH